MGKEIEKKYLLSTLPTEVTKPKNIKQGYLSVGDPEVRVRQKGDKFFVTKKSGEGFVRIENEEEVSKETFDILWPAANSKTVEKIRYKIIGPDEMTWEIDEYFGNLKGLFTAEIELPDEDFSIQIPQSIQNVLVADVTEDNRYKNKNLAVDGIPL